MKKKTVKKTAKKHVKIEENNGVTLIAKERWRQIEKEGWTPEHDDKHKNGELVHAAAAYAVYPETAYRLGEFDDGDKLFSDIFPKTWDRVWDKRENHDDIKRLAIAGALIAAEIDRILRMRMV